MRQLLNDNRALPRTMDEADVVFVRLASLTAKRNRVIAKLEESVKALQAKAEPELAALKKEISEAEEQLSGFVLANQRLFARPRQHKTAFGQYGLRTATKLLVRDQQALVRFSDEQELGLYETAIRVKNTTVSALLKKGISVPGAELQTGDIVGYTISFPTAEAEQEAAK